MTAAPALTAGDVMTDDVAMVEAGSALPAAILLMLDRHVSGLPLLDDAGMLVGI